MTITKKLLVLLLACLLIGSFAFAGGQKEGAAAPSATGKITIAFVPKTLGIAVFDAMDNGAKEAAKDTGANVEIVYQGPSSPTAEGQISIISTLIAQHVNAIEISTNDTDALVPICKKAMDAGIKVISYDSAIAPEGRILHVAPWDDEQVGRSAVQLISKMIKNTGEIAILSTSATTTNQNTWIKWMKAELQDPKYANLKLDAIAYGYDEADKSYTEAMGLFKSYPNLAGIISPTTIGIAAAAKALEDASLAGKIQLTGYGLPSQMKKYIQDGTCTAMELYNPVDLGYASTFIAYDLVKGNLSSVKVGDSFDMGRMGKRTVLDGNVIVQGNTFVFDKSNIDQYAAIF